ncbi:MAG: iron-containing alcohol dehydrogenase [Bacteroidota bacterium]
MVYKQQAYLPIVFQVDEGIFLDVEHYLRRNKLSFTKVLVVSGKTVSFEYAQKLIDKYNWDNYILKDNTYEDVEELKALCEDKRYDLIIAVGGGTVLDSVKRVSYLTNINHLSMPTIISNDGLISPISVIKNAKGKTESIPGMMPMGVIIDLDIIKESPIHYLRAAAGDILSNISATNDWVIAAQKTDEHLNDIGFHLSKSAGNALIHFDKVDLTYKPFLRMVVQGQVNSGIAMSLAGSSRPCSGSEHLLSHAIDYLELSNGTLHGLQVASTSLFTLYLQNKLRWHYIDYAQKTEMPLDFTELLASNDEEVVTEIFSKAKIMRPGRVTILDFLDQDQFLDQLKNYKKLIKGEPEEIKEIIHSR